MARLPRFCPPGLPQHVIQRGNNRSACFVDDRDFAAYASWLEDYSNEHGVDVHAWVFMTNHVHLLVTPKQEGALSAMMQAIGRRYVRYFNHCHSRSGTLWEGRYKSSLVQTESYLLNCYRYIELNPVRAGLASDPVDYPWSSYRCNALGVKSRLCTPHEEYLKLGKDRAEQSANYRALFDTRLQSVLMTEIRDALNSGLALGNESFKEKIERLYGRRVRQAKMGRPAKSFI